MIFRNVGSALCLLAIGCLWQSDQVFGQDPPLEDPPLNRTLSGAADFGDQGRYLGTQLGSLTLTSDDLGMDPAHSISVSPNGFAYLPGNLLIRNGSGSALTFDSSNQSHNFDVFYAGTGQFDEDVTLPSMNAYANGSGETVTAFGGNWFWQADFNRLNGQQQTFDVNDLTRGQFVQPRFSPLTLGSSTVVNEIRDKYNRTNSTVLAPESKLPLINADNELQWSLVENQTPIIVRQNTLFEVAGPAEGQPQPTLDLSSINIQASGVALANRRIGAYDPRFNSPDGIKTTAVVDLGRQMVGAATSNFNTSDSLTLVTRRDDDERTRLTLNGFNQQSDGVTATLGNAVVFNADDSTATVGLTGNFSVDSSQAGTFTKTVDVGSFIAGEGLAGETKQGTLSVGYQYAFVENNSAVSKDATVFRLEGVNGAGEMVTNFSAVREFDIHTHTDIGVSKTAILTGNSGQTVSLSAGNGIWAEGLTGENVTATTSYQIHQKVVEGTDLSLTESGDRSDLDIVFENKRVVNGAKLQAQAIVTNVIESGSSRWTLDGLDGWDLDLAAGESLTLTPTFDDGGIDPSSTLGRNYQKSVTFEFQDGLRNMSTALETDSVLGLVNDGANGSSSFEIIGSDETHQQATYDFERNYLLQGETGSAVLKAGTTLKSEGINLTNTVENSTLGSPTEFRLVDSAVLEGETTVDVAFFGLSIAEDEASKFFGTDVDPLISDIVDISGLDGILQVLEVSYDPLYGRADLLWLDEDEGLWVNAVLGNSNFTGDETQAEIEAYLAANRFEGSYNQYLESLGTDGSLALGAFGSGSGRAWAVIDHNSAFAVVSAVPEPGSLWLALVTVAGFSVRRRRS